MVTFADDVTFHLNGDEIRVFHVPPAHTDGDAIVHFVEGRRDPHGRHLLQRHVPVHRHLERRARRRRDRRGDRVLALADDETRIIPGHGPLANKADLKAYRDMLAAVCQRVHKMIADGKKLDEITAADRHRRLRRQVRQGLHHAAKFAEMVAMNILKNP